MLQDTNKDMNINSTSFQKKACGFCFHNNS